jgi:transcription elongation GreA/GreB family factor
LVATRIAKTRRAEVSVAFRRESDEEHKEPRFELPIPSGPNLVTAKGLTLIEARVATLEAAAAADMGEGEEAKAAQEDRKRDLRYWRTRLATAQPMPLPGEDEVAFGARVRFRLNGKVRTIDIVGDDEAEPAAGRIAFSAPLARAMIGAEVGERVDFGDKAEAIEILDTAPLPD